MKDDTPNANIDPSTIVQGHNGEVQRFTLHRSVIIQDRRSKRQCREFLVEDQFGNLYLIYRAKLHDGEDYDVAACGDGWVNKPSLLLRYGGFNDALVDDCRTQAFHAFDEAAKSINAARALADSVGFKGDVSKLVLPSNVENN